MMREPIMQKKAAKLQIERAARELAWAQAYKIATLAIAHGSPRILPFDMTPYDPYQYAPVKWQADDKLVVFFK